jgi:hypothetical protein
MGIMRLTPALFLLWILATTSAALAPQAEPGFEPFEELPLVGQGTFLRAVSGEFTGDGIPDAVVLRDQRVSLLYGPNQYRGPGGNALSFTLTNDENESESVSDIAVFAEGGFDLTDAILTVGPEGLVRWRWLPNSGGFERVEIPGPWSAPQRIATWHPPASPLGWVAVLRADGLTVDVLTFVEATGDPLSQTTRQLGPHIEEIGLYDGNQDVTPEIFAIRNGDLEVWDLYDSLPAVTIPAGPGGGHVAVLREADTSAERLAWVTEVDGQLAIQTVAGVVVDSPVFIGPYVLETIAGGDYDRDGYEDLLVASSSPERFVVYRNQQGDGSSQTFDPGLPVSVLGEGEADRKSVV